MKEGDVVRWLVEVCSPESGPGENVIAETGTFVREEDDDHILVVRDEDGGDEVIPKKRIFDPKEWSNNL